MDVANTLLPIVGKWVSVGGSLRARPVRLADARYEEVRGNRGAAIGIPGCEQPSKPAAPRPQAEQG